MNHVAQPWVRKEVIGNATLYLGDCLEILPTLPKVDAVITDPPYPDYYVELYKQTDIAFLNEYQCKQFVFWSSRLEFPLSWTARHVWDKRKGGAGSAYEFIYERNGSGEQWVFSYVSIQNETRADFSREIFSGHKSQKPFRLMERLVSKCGGVIVDPFMGSGTTAVACTNLGLPCVGIEIEPKYFDIACERITNAQRQQRMEFA
jgi:site-specific DNA-methyltransferase (adenine-specific)